MQPCQAICGAPRGSVQDGLAKAVVGMSALTRHAGRDRFRTVKSAVMGFGLRPPLMRRRSYLGVGNFLS